MSNCRFWWRTGDVQWCDMKGNGCRCGGWDECCDMKGMNRQAVVDVDADPVEAEFEATLASKKSTHRKLKGAA